MGSSLGGAALGGASSALVGNLLSEVCPLFSLYYSFRSDTLTDQLIVQIEKLFRRDEGMQRRAPLFSSKPSTSSSGGTGTALLGSAIGGAASGAVGNLLNEVCSNSFFAGNNDPIAD